MARMFNKKITTPEAMAIYTEIRVATKEKQQMADKENQAYGIYLRMEGKYAIDKINDDMVGMGYRGYFYDYATPEDKEREEQERKEYFNNNIVVCQETQKILDNKIQDLTEQLCILLWGYGTERYRLERALLKEQKDLAAQMENIKKIQQQIEQLKNK